MNVAEQCRIASDRVQTIGEEWANSLSHGVGFLAALMASPILLLAAFHRDNHAMAGVVVFVITILLLYLGSALYHAWPRSRAKAALQLFDHAAIFLLIAGTYTPFILGPMRSPTGFVILGVVWLLAIVGITFKIVHGPDRYTKIALALYLGMGWLGLIFVRDFAAVVSGATVLWLLAGGFAYTFGIFFFVREHARYNHFIWHLFVLGGTTCHFCAVFSCVA